MFAKQYYKTNLVTQKRFKKTIRSEFQYPENDE